MSKRVIQALTAVVFLATFSLDVRSAPQGECTKLSVSVGSPAQALFIRFPRIRLPRFISNAVRAVGRAVSGVAKGIKNVAGSIAKGVASGVKKIGQGIKKIGQGVAQVARGVGKVVGGVVKGAVKFTGGVLRGAGKLIKGDFKGAWNDVKSGAKAGARAFTSGVKSGFKDIKNGALKAADGLKDVAMGALEVAMAFFEPVKRALQAFMESSLGKWLMPILQKVADKLFGLNSGKILSAIQTVERIVNTISEFAQKVATMADEIKSWVQDPQGKVREKIMSDPLRGRIVGWLADKAYNLLKAPIEKLAGALANTAIKAFNNVLAPILSGIAAGAIQVAVPFVPGAALQPLLQKAAKMLLDFLADKLESTIGRTAVNMGFIRDFIKGKMITPLIGKAYNKIADFLITKLVPGAEPAGG